jgi:hypothetical protein
MGGTALSNIELVNLKPSHLSEIVAWDISSTQSFFRFSNPLKITTQNLLSLMNSKESFNRIALDKTTQKLLAFLTLSNHNVTDGRAQLGFAYNPSLAGDAKLLEGLLAMFCVEGIKFLKLNKIQSFLITSDVMMEKLLLRMGALKEGVLTEHFFNEAKFRNVAVYGLFQENL